VRALAVSLTIDLVITGCVVLSFAFIVIPLAMLPSNRGFEAEFFHTTGNIRFVYAPLLFLVYAVALYLIRHYRRVSYGLAEIIIGAIGFFYIEDNMIIENPLLPILFQLSAAIYIGVRGLDNLVLGIKARLQSDRDRNS